MQRRTAIVMGAIVVGGLGIGYLGTPATGRAETAVQEPARPRVGWGEPRDGLQIGLFPQSQKKQFRYGDTIALVMRVRNVSGSPLELSMKPPNITSVTLGESGRLVLQTLGGGGNAVPLQLAPRETKELSGGRYAAQIVAPGEKPEPANKAQLALALLPGEYHAECDYPIWMPDKDDANRATAHHAKPGIFTFVVLQDEPRQPAKGKDENAFAASITWGETVNGIQGGVRRLTDQDLAALPVEQRKERAANEILTRFYIRNTTDKPLRLAFHNFTKNDASFWIKDAKGQDYPVHSVFFTGLRALAGTDAAAWRSHAGRHGPTEVSDAANPERPEQSDPSADGGTGTVFVPAHQFRTLRRDEQLLYGSNERRPPVQRHTAVKSTTTTRRDQRIWTGIHSRLCSPI